MLVLSRKRGESIVCETKDGVKIVFTVCDHQSGSGDKIRVGIEADKSVRVDRLEVAARREVDERKVG